LRTGGIYAGVVFLFHETGMYAALSFFLIERLLVNAMPFASAPVKNGMVEEFAAAMYGALSL
jgi:hypothetical protein